MKKNKWALITGASIGLGYEYCHQLAAKGYSIVGVSRNSEALGLLKTSLSKYDQVSVEVISHDLSDLTQLDALSQKLFSEERHFEILINNAGFACTGPFRSMTLENVNTMLNLNLSTPVHLSHTFIRHMQDHGKKSYILNVGSLAAFGATTSVGIYGSSKSFLWMFSIAISKQLKHTNISVTFTGPGAIDTQFRKNSIPPENDEPENALSTKLVAEESLSAMFQEKQVNVPGRMNYVKYLIMKHSPNWLLNILLK